jgi:hypothetical protein
MDFASPDLGLRLNLDAGRRTPPRPTPGLGHNLGLGRRSPPRPTPWLGLNLDAGRRTPPRPIPGLRLNLDSEDGLRLARPQGTDSTSTSEEPPPRLT